MVGSSVVVGGKKCLWPAKAFTYRPYYMCLSVIYIQSYICDSDNIIRLYYVLTESHIWYMIYDMWYIICIYIYHQMQPSRPSLLSHFSPAARFDGAAYGSAGSGGGITPLGSSAYLSMDCLTEQQRWIRMGKNGDYHGIMGIYRIYKHNLTCCSLRC